jgi:hypothetical protein
MSKVKNAEKKIVEKDDATPAKSGARIFTYTGAGADSPRVINFMGVQKFVRGQATEVTDAKVISKIENNPTFVEGEVDQEDLHEIDEAGAEVAKEKTLRDTAMNAVFRKNHVKE